MVRLRCSHILVCIGALFFQLTGPVVARSVSAVTDTVDVQRAKYWITFERRTDPPPESDRWTTPVSKRYVRELRAVGVNPLVRSRWFHAVSAYLTPSERETVQTLPFVKRTVRLGTADSETEPRGARYRPDRTPPFSSPPEVPVDFGASRAHLSRINAVHPIETGFDGRGVRVGFLDANFRALRHPAFSKLRREDRLIALRDFTEGTQRGNHGSAVASVAVGYAPGRLVGPAYKAEVVGATTEYTPSERNAEEDYFVAGLEWLHRRGVDVVNVSVGYNTFDEGQKSYTSEDLDGNTGITTRAVDRAARLGMTVVVSAGNSGCTSPDSCWYYVNTPADADSAITVGAIQPDSTLAPFSSRGPTADDRRKPDVVVQGTEVVAAWDNGSYAQVGGTSFASPQVTGVVAQMLQVNPDLFPTQIRSLLRQTASQPQEPDNRKGWGVANARLAIAGAERMARRTPPAALTVERPYPNPVSDRLTFPVRLPSRERTVHLTLYSPLGRSLVKRTYTGRPGPNWFTLNLSGVPSGLYQYELRGLSDIKRGTVVIDR